MGRIKYQLDENDGRKEGIVEKLGENGVKNYKVISIMT